ncbi:MAG: 2-phosphosulfolactate phosphatase [Bacillota bacterium]
MRIDVISQYAKLTDNQLASCTSIVVDLLRASTTIIYAIKNGASQIIPASDPGDAVTLSSRLGGRDCVLCGERGGLKLPGFELGNSPLEYTPEIVKGKTVILSTTNGTLAIQSVRSSATMLIGALVNCTAVAKAAIQAGNDVVIQCAGTEGQFSADDAVAAGAIVDTLQKNLGAAPTLNDLAFCSRMLYQDYLDGRLDVSRTFHYGRLVELGFNQDVELCFQRDTTDVVPVYRNGVIVAK